MRSYERFALYCLVAVTPAQFPMRSVQNAYSISTEIHSMSDNALRCAVLNPPRVSRTPRLHCMQCAITSIRYICTGRCGKHAYRAAVPP